MLIYLDDILIAAESEERRKLPICATVHLLRALRVLLNIEKSILNLFFQLGLARMLSGCLNVQSSKRESIKNVYLSGLSLSGI